MSEEYHYQCTLSRELVELAEKELNEKASWRERDIEALRTRVKENKDLKCPLDSAFLLRFLRARKFDYDRAYELLIKHYTVRATNRQYLSNLTPSKCTDVIDEGIITLLPSRDIMGRRVVYARFGRWNPKEMEMMQLFRITLLTMEHAIRDEETQVRGVVVVVDWSGVGLIHLRNINTSLVRNMIYLMQNAFPIRIKGIHYIHEPSIFFLIFTIIRPFLTSKIFSRHRFHGASLDSLQGCIGADALPLELGGALEAGDVLAQAWKRELMEEEEYFEAMTHHHITTNVTNVTTTPFQSYCRPYTS